MKQLLLILTLFISPFVLKAQTAESLFAQAMDQKDEGRLLQAKRDLMRVHFFANDSLKILVQLPLAEILETEGSFAEAVKYYELAFHSETNKELKQQHALSISRCLLLNRNYVRAKAELIQSKQMYQLEADPYWNFQMGIASYSLGEMDLAKNHWQSLVKESKQEEFEKLFIKVDRAARKNPSKAAWMSAFIPGSGQFYAGDPKKGTASLILTGGLMALTISTGINYSILDAGLSVFPWYSRYYFGGIKQAKNSVIQRRQQKHNKIYGQLIRCLELSWYSN